ncbi:hypothetical protein SNE25_20605 [Mucilaginibacter sabulilitoris]|uniref:Uncharacterized protein n=1 Tax=Mucilaginibacter sabulilitoris TaxID=1173583 RepID=A0ABZ0TFE6_9SPHI|nr:hypothetical protein [Mucilaginibacter sabulilitoris]WPU91723.1 hypothetical protein SNE25_20605 [Mucilaginibacter sabulilitoris]
MKESKLILCSIVFLLMIGKARIAAAQCSQCVATVETNRQAGNDGLAKGLNHGILYLLVAPYAAIGLMGFIWYKKYRRTNVNLNMRNEKLNLN